MTTNLRLWSKEFSRAEWETRIEPGDAKRLSRERHDLAELQEEEPGYRWVLQTRGTASTWHDLA